MTESDTTETAAVASSEQPDPVAPTDEQDAAEESEILSETMVRYLYRGAFGFLAVLAVVATVQFYLNVSQTISVWIAPDYQPLFQAAFNLSVVVACTLGLVLLVQRVR